MKIPVSNKLNRMIMGLLKIAPDMDDLEEPFVLEPRFVAVDDVVAPAASVSVEGSAELELAPAETEIGLVSELALTKEEIGVLSSLRVEWAKR